MHPHDASRDPETSFLSKETLEVCFESQGITLMDELLDIVLGLDEMKLKFPRQKVREGWDAGLGAKGLGWEEAS